MFYQTGNQAKIKDIDTMFAADTSFSLDRGEVVNAVTSC